MQFIYLIYKFLVCLVLSEKKVFSDRINYYISFFQIINIVKFIFYLFQLKKIIDYKYLMKFQRLNL